jgi:hypothetical protein
MVKTFCDNNIEPLEVKLINNKGEKVIKKAKFLTIKECKEMSRSFNNIKEDNSTGEKSFNILQDQMAFIFGGESEEYEDYTPSLLKDVLSWVTGEIVNPTKKEQNKEKK